MSTKQIYHYTDFRRFIQDQLRDKQAKNPRMSMRALAKYAGFSSPGYCQMVMKGLRNPTSSSVKKFIRLFNLDPAQSRYFHLLVLFELSKSFEEKRKIFGEMRLLADREKRKESASQGAKQTWCGLILFELAYCKGFVLTESSAYRALNGGATLREIRRTFRELVQQGVLEKRTGGIYSPRRTDTLRSTDEVEQVFLRKIHAKFSKTAIEALKLPLHNREFQTVTVALSEERFVEVKQLLKGMADELLAFAANDPEASQVYQIGLMGFPVSLPVSPNKTLEPNE